MADYEGNTCPVCKNKFKDGDDIVVCPDCGTPYHRACWQKAGECVHSAEHAAGFEWKPDKAPEPEDVVCPNCGTHNPAGAQFCNHCGVPLPVNGETAVTSASTAARPLYTNGAAQGNTRNTAPQAVPHIETFAADESGVYRREVGPDDPIGGIKARDWASYIGNSSLYYLMQFFRMEETKRKVSISFSALFLGPVYFFYRKMWKEGAVFTALSALLAIPSVLLVLALSEAPIVAGMPVGWLSTALNVCSILSWAAMVLRALFAIYWYKQQCAANIKRIYDTIPDGQERSDALAMRGGVSVVAVVAYVIAYFLLGLLLFAVMGPNMNAVMAALTL